MKCFAIFLSSVFVLLFVSSLDGQACATLRLSDETVSANGQATVRLSMDSTCRGINGWSYGVCHDGALVEVSSIIDGATTAIVDAGGPPFFNAVTLFPGNGFTVGTVLSFGTPQLPAGTDYELNLATYDAIASSGSSAIEFCDGLGAPPTFTAVVVGGNTTQAATVNGSIRITSNEFVRLDCSGDGVTNLADPIFFLLSLFPGTGTPPILPCQDACDCNDDGVLDLADAICSMAALFGVSTAPPAPPFPGCGLDPTGDALDCASFATCP